VPQLGTTIPRDKPAAIAIREARAQLDAAHGNLPAALSNYGENIEVLSRPSLGPTPLIQTLVARAEVYLQFDRPSEALADVRRALDLARKSHRPQQYSSSIGESLLMLARVERRFGRQDEARASAAAALPHLDATLGAQHPLTLLARGQMR
jgi:tetratricopeptide (TPR) repeat protein